MAQAKARCGRLPRLLPLMQVQRMGLREFRLLVDSGDLMLPSVVTANLALRALEARGLIGRE